jgi:hypothetical protein
MDLQTAPLEKEKQKPQGSCQKDGESGRGLRSRGQTHDHTASLRKCSGSVLMAPVLREAEKSGRAGCGGVLAAMSYNVTHDDERIQSFSKSNGKQLIWKFGRSGPARCLRMPLNSQPAKSTITYKIVFSQDLRLATA